MPHSYTSLFYHIVFSTKERYPFLNRDMRARVLDYLGGAVRSEDGTSFIVNGVADHVHILARLRQDKALADVLRDIKANSSGWIHDHFPGLSKFALANRICGVHSQQVSDWSCATLHCKPGSTSPEGHFPGRIDCFVESSRD